MDENPPSLLTGILIFVGTILVGWVIIAGIIVALFSSCIEIAKPIVESGAIVISQTQTMIYF